MHPGYSYMQGGIPGCGCECRHSSLIRLVPRAAAAATATCATSPPTAATAAPSTILAATSSPAAAAISCPCAAAAHGTASAAALANTAGSGHGTGRHCAAHHVAYLRLGQVGWQAAHDREAREQTLGDCQPVAQAFAACTSHGGKQC